MRLPLYILYDILFAIAILPLYISPVIISMEKAFKLLFFHNISLLLFLHNISLLFPHNISLLFLHNISLLFLHNISLLFLHNISLLFQELKYY